MGGRWHRPNLSSKANACVHHECFVPRLSRKSLNRDIRIYVSIPGQFHHALGFWLLVLEASVEPEWAMAGNDVYVGRKNQSNLPMNKDDYSPCGVFHLNLFHTRKRRG